jgi:large subunit ribosomal protein LP0
MSEGGVNTKSSKYPRKKAFFEKFTTYLKTYKKVMILHADNVGSYQMQKVRVALRGRAELLMGKNTMMRKIIRSAMEENPKLEALLPSIEGNIGLLFTHEEFTDMHEVISTNRVPAAAKFGAMAPIDVFIPAGVTELDPAQTAFLQVLGIATKITKGKIEILADVHVVKKTEKVGSSEAALLQKLGIRPFTYGLETLSLYDDGSVFDKEVLFFKEADIVQRLMAGVSNVAAVALAINVPTLASSPHSILNAFKNVLALSVETDYTFPQSEKVKAFLADPSAFAAAAPAPAAGGGGGAAAKPAAAPAKESSEEDDDMGFSLFD